MTDSKFSPVSPAVDIGSTGSTEFPQSWGFTMERQGYLCSHTPSPREYSNRELRRCSTGQEGITPHLASCIGEGAGGALKLCPPKCSHPHFLLLFLPTGLAVSCCIMLRCRCKSKVRLASGYGTLEPGEGSVVEHPAYQVCTVQRAHGRNKRNI